MSSIPNRSDYDTLEEWMTAVSKETKMDGDTLQAIVEQLQQQSE